ncbi:hypothetical protein AV530_003034 [Patagioenas fasciata monilis]|uniref:Uncharacterized protein n=1 Tax=Patagioenas fasciata monilis TaxID=372326 RepID=A0A1V4KW08_PATFA|nr:hypothetical protein AV530_003034 [Patagioenas fasciata monilis]
MRVAQLLAHKKQRTLEITSSWRHEQSNWNRAQRLRLITAGQEEFVSGSNTQSEHSVKVFRKENKPL